MYYAATVPAIVESQDDSAEVANACLDAFRKKAKETSEFHASNSGTEAGNSRGVLQICSSRPELKVTKTPRDALIRLSYVLRKMGVLSVVPIGSGKFSEVFSGRNAEGNTTGHAIKVSKTASSLVSIKEGQAGTEAFAMHLGAMYAKSGGFSPFMPALELLAVPADGDQYVAVLLMDEAKGTATEFVKMLAKGIMSDGSFSHPGLEKARAFFRALLERLLALHKLGIAHRDLKPANILMDGVNTVFLSDPAFAMFPTSVHILPSPGASPPIQKRPSQLGTERAQQILLGATGGKDVQHSPLENQAPRSIVAIDPTELEMIFTRQFRISSNAGTHAFTGPEFPFRSDRGAMTSSDFLPGDMWAVGIILLRIFSGDKAPWVTGWVEKTTMANSSPQDFWVKYLTCSGTPSADPTVLSAIDFVRRLLQADPAERLTCSAALEHPFLQRQ